MTETLVRPTFERPVGLPRRGAVRFVDVPERRLLAVDGEGEPGGAEFQEAFQALYSTAYTLHFALKKTGQEPGTIGALEGLWERTDASPETPFDEAGDPAAWRWRVMLPMPDAATEADLAAAMEAAAAKKEIPGLARLRLVTWTEGPCVEALHVGPYATERETIDRMLAAAAERGLRPHGAHHEIYLGDPRRSDPAKLRTVLRQPVEPA
ncbi:MAG TPA: GyrI-like domain-containing protein [Candidatus Dormibacteraeota bacterium]|nr:GyrI-like domain-containing protein [Candidatus Dormibacteraeota bacterium]